MAAETGGDTAGEAEDSAGAPGGGTGQPAAQASRSVIHIAAMTVTVDDVDDASTSLTRIATSAGGSVATADVSLEPPAYALVTVKVPPPALDDVVAQVAELGRVTERTQSAQDVTTQVVDLEARITSAQASVARVRAFLEQAETITDLALLEAELTSRETALEQLLAQQRALSEQVDLATLTVTLVESDVTRSVSLVGLVETEPPGVLAAFESGLAALGAGVWWAIVVLAAVLPFLVVATGIALAARWLVRRRRRRPSAGHPAAHGAPDAPDAPGTPLPPPPA